MCERDALTEWTHVHREIVNNTWIVCMHNACPNMHGHCTLVTDGSRLRFGSGQGSPSGEFHEPQCAHYSWCLSSLTMPLVLPPKHVDKGHCTCCINWKRWFSRADCTSCQLLHWGNYPSHWVRCTLMTSHASHACMHAHMPHTMVGEIQGHGSWASACFNHPSPSSNVQISHHGPDVLGVGWSGWTLP